MEQERKRPSESAGDIENTAKKQKTGADARSQQRRGAGGRRFAERVVIEPGDVGIWATCNRGKEAKCVGELRDLFQEHAENIYPSEAGNVDEDADEDGGDIEADIKAELKDMKKPAKEPLFTNIRLDVDCVIFFRVRPPIEPVSFVHAVCKDAAATGRQRTRFVKRLTPMTKMARATEDGLRELAQEVLAPHFHADGASAKKFAIRPSLRNNDKSLNRDVIIKEVAKTVGPGHSVDLKNYDVLILVEVYQNILGMSVVGNDFEELKRYNLWELCQTEVAKDG